ncbi:MAG: septal ring lytic transglycosylase RlpA family protein [Candidatus Acidiferrales bacterium]
MRTKNSFEIAAVFLGIILWFVAPVLNAPSAAPAADAKVSAKHLQPSSQLLLATPNPSLAPKPLMVWECVSSWYGEDFDGRPTANGETYDMFGVTAASPTLPLGSIVRVVNTRNHRSQIVRINDRGPYVEGRDLDVSYEVARRLGFDQRGLAKVRLELLEVPSRPSSPRPE